MTFFKLGLMLVFFNIFNWNFTAQTAEEYKAQGEDYYSNKQYTLAINSFSKAIELGENDDFTYFLRAFSYLQTQAYDKSLVDFSKCTGPGKEYSDKANFYKGVIFSANNELDSAINCYNLALSSDPKNTVFLPHRALCFQKAGKDLEALQDYSICLEENPEDLAVLGNSIVSQLHLDHYEEALKIFQKMESIDPNFLRSDDFGNRAIAKLNTSDFKGALEDCNLALKANPEEADFLNTRGLVYLKLNKKKEALSDFDKAIASNDKHLNAYINRGYLKIQQKKFASALEDIDKANELGCNCSDVHFYRGVANYNLKKPETALEEFDKAIALFKADLLYTEGEIYYQKGLCYKQLKNKEKACENFKKAVALNYAEAQKMLEKECKK